MNIDTGRLIAEVAKRKCLWDVSDEDYPNRPMKLRVWAKLTKKLIPAYDNLNEAERNSMVIRVQQRWRNARDSYGKVRLAKRKPKPCTDIKKKKYIFYDQLRFLDKLEKLKTRESVDTTETHLESSERELNNDNDVSKEVLKKLKPYKRYKIKTEAVDVIETYPEIFMEETNNDTNESKEVFRKLESQERPKIRKRSSELSKNRLMKIANQVSNSRKDDDLDFFTSLLAIVKQLSSRDKLVFRSQVMINLMEIYQHPNSLAYAGASGSAPSSRKVSALLNSTPDTPLEEMSNSPCSSRQANTEVENPDEPTQTWSNLASAFQEGNALLNEPYYILVTPEPHTSNLQQSTVASYAAGASTSTATLAPAIEHVEVKKEASEEDFDEPPDDSSWFESTDNFKAELHDDQYLSENSAIVEVPIDNLGKALKRPRLGISGSSAPTDKQQNVSKTKDIKETEFDMFGRSIGTQLNNMPLRDALELQLALQKVITDYRLSKFVA